jgi:hypothetical protein
MEFRMTNRMFNHGLFSNSVAFTIAAKSNNVRFPITAWWRFFAMLLTFASLILSGCVATLEHTPESVHLCKQLAESNGWDEWGGGGELTVKDVRYLFTFSDETDHIVSPIPRTFWVGIDGFSSGKAAGYRAPPMMYDPSEATIEMRGRKIHALPHAWLAGLVNGYYEPTKEVQLPFNLNEKGAAPTVIRIFIAFPIDAPEPKDVYVLSPGTILLDGERTVLPTKRSCYSPSKTWWYSIR